MPINFTVPSDLEALVQKRLASGRFANVEEVFRHALEAQDAEENWTAEERSALDEKIDRALAQLGQVSGPEEARRKLAAMRESHLECRG
jgi:Arc/MetJ-type ribon-helix-helix transcriptional regulator